MIFDDRICKLGEGPLWHPERQEFLWFDILSKKLLSAKREWQFDLHVSAAGWVDHDTLLVAAEGGLYKFNLETEAMEKLVGLEADVPGNRSNDGRADPQGGFWIGTMHMDAAENAGAIYRYYRGELRQLYPNVSIPNSICFAPDGKTAYWADTRPSRIYKQTIDVDTGWPVGAPEIFLDLLDQDLNPDGSVVDAEGNLWNAQWGASRMACYAPDGTFLREIKITASQATCPAFGGADLSDLYCTSASIGLGADHIAAHPDTGKTFVFKGETKGQAEHRVIL